MLADRRLTYQTGKPKDDARKILLLDTADSVAIIGYAGLGATGSGTEPSEWMSSVLRGRKLRLEQALCMIVDAMKKQFPRHMVSLPEGSSPSHNVIISAFVDGVIRLYTIDMFFSNDRRNFRFRFTQHVTEQSLASDRRPPRIALTGSGAQFLMMDKRWIRGLLRLVKASDNGQVSERVVADFLANINIRTHFGVSDGTVGPRCIVAWRHNKNSSFKGGGGHQYYTGSNRDESSWALPTLANGLEIHSIANLMVPYAISLQEAMIKGNSSSNEVIDYPDMRRLPYKPDEELK